MLDVLAQAEISGTVMALDFGEQRIGVAVGNTLLCIAHPLQTINTEVTERRFADIAALMREWQPIMVLVGLPCYMDGREHEISRLSRRFARRLQGRLGIKVAMWDERLSSVAASQTLGEIGIKGQRQKSLLDQIAAQHILQHYFDTPNNNAHLIWP